MGVESMASWALTTNYYIFFTISTVVIMLLGPSCWVESQVDLRFISENMETPKTCVGTYAVYFGASTFADTGGYTASVDASTALDLGVSSELKQIFHDILILTILNSVGAGIMLFGTIFNSGLITTIAGAHDSAWSKSTDDSISSSRGAALFFTVVGAGLSFGVTLYYKLKITQLDKIRLPSIFGKIFPEVKGVFKPLGRLDYYPILATTGLILFVFVGIPVITALLKLLGMFLSFVYSELVDTPSRPAEVKVQVQPLRTASASSRNPSLNSTSSVPGDSSAYHPL